MRVVSVAALLFLSACAGEKLASAPPPGVNFSGTWRLNEADSDDPLHLLQSQIEASGAEQASVAAKSSRGGAIGGFGGGPPMPGIGELNDGLRWPAKVVEIKQAAGVVSITSAGTTQVCKPVAPSKSHRHRESIGGGASSRRDMPARDRREVPPPTCGWDDRTLVVQSGDFEDEAPPFINRFSVSGDGQRLIEVVAFQGRRSGGFSVSRVWDRVPPGGVPPGGVPRDPSHAAADPSGKGDPQR